MSKRVGVPRNKKYTCPILVITIMSGALTNQNATSANAFCKIRLSLRRLQVIGLSVYRLVSKKHEDSLHLLWEYHNHGHQ